jgi:hypothetical protein
VYRSEGFIGKVFGWEGFGSFGVFVPVTLKLGGLKVPSTFGIKDLSLIHELNLCLSITTRIYTYCGFVLSSEVRLLYQVCFLLVSPLI